MTFDSTLQARIDSQPAMRNAGLIHRVMITICALVSLVYSFITLTHAQHLIGPTGLTESWMSILHEAFARHSVFGRECVFTYGPWGFLFGGCTALTLAWWLPIRLLLAGLLWLALWRLAHPLFPRALPRAAFVVLCVILIAMGGDDAQINAFSVLLLFTAMRQARDWLVLIPLCLSVALCAWVKHSALVAGTVVVLAVSFVDLIARRRPIVLLIWFAAMLFFWMLARQPIGALGAYFRNSWETMSGYGAAMEQSSPQAPRAMAFYAGGALALVGVVGLNSRHSKSGASIVAGAIAAWAMIVFKESFVRQDTHMEIAGPSLMLAILLAMTQWPDRRFVTIGLGSIALLLAANVSIAVGSIWIEAREQFAAAPIRATELANSFADLIHAKPARAQDPVPFTGSLDAFPWPGPAGFDQIHWRPVFHSYCAYTPRLAQLNADFLRSNSAPPHLLWRVQPIDNHYPSLEDPLAWPEVLAGYHCSGDVAGQLILSRNARRSFFFRPITENTGRIGQSIDVPPAPSHRLWTKIHLTPTRLGAARSLLYRPAELNLIVTDSRDRTTTFKFIPTTAACGFLLNPIITRDEDFAMLVSGKDLDALPTARKITIAPTTPDSFLGYEPQVRCEFFDMSEQ